MTDVKARVSAAAAAPTGTGNDNDDILDLHDPNVGFWDKWNKHVTQKKTKGIIRHASFCNRWSPRIYYFSCLGGTGWMVWGSIPYYYGNNPMWLIGMEAFTIYLFVQVMANYFLTKTTDSGYYPEMSTSETVAMNKGNDCNTTFQQQTKQPLSSNLKETTTTSSSSSPSSPTAAATTSESSGSSYRILVATSVTGNDVERKSFPYWSWVPCLICQRLRPPRCHHCTLCEKCVLKRDHHCYFVNACIGVNNHRYYMYFLFWCVVLTWFACSQLIPYLFGVVLTRYSYWNLCTPYTFYSVVTGSLPCLYMYFILVVWGVFFLTFISTGMFTNGLYTLLRGLTSFEQSHKIKIMDTRNYSGRLQSVFGKNWGINILIPGYLTKALDSHFPEHLRPTEPIEDAVNWPYIKTE